ncbi:TPA: hypothetical protein ACJTDP_002839 [Yersinia enterocolitica]
MARSNCARTGRRDDSSTLAVVACVVTMGSTNKAGNGIGGDAVDMNSVNNAFLNPMGTFSFVNATNWGGGGAYRYFGVISRSLECTFDGGR